MSNLYRKLLKVISVILLCFVWGSTAQAQHWCPPGATWYYTDESADVSGFSKLTYVSDTVINTINCKKITNYTKLTVWQTTYTYYYSPFYTYEQNGVAYLYNNRYSNNKFDTLFNINAQIGDKWRLPLLDTACVDSIYFIKVLNTGTKSVNGVSLKWLYVQAGPLGGSFPYGLDTITEKFGYRYDDICYSFVCNNSPDECAHGGLRCYSDSTFGFYSTNTNIPCDYFYTDVSELEQNALEASIYPSPFSSNLTISNTRFSIQEINIYNLTGQLNYTLNNIDAHDSSIDLSFLENGIYFIKIKYDNEGVFLQKVIKNN